MACILSTLLFGSAFFFAIETRPPYYEQVLRALMPDGLLYAAEVSAGTVDKLVFCLLFGAFYGFLAGVVVHRLLIAIVCGSDRD